MVFQTHRLVKNELKNLKKIRKELEDVEERTERSIHILKKMASNLEKGGEFKKGQKLRNEILHLEKEIYEDEKAEKLEVLVEETLPRIIKGKL